MQGLAAEINASGVGDAAATGASSSVLSSPVYIFFPRYLAKVLLDGKCYEHLRHFSPIFNDLKTHGADLPAVAPLLQSLAQFDLSSDAALAIDGATHLQMRAVFFTSAVYQDFLRSARQLVYWSRKSVRIRSKERMFYSNLLKAIVGTRPS